MLGYGINVGPAAYPPELRDRATSLESELGRHVDRALLLVESLAQPGAAVRRPARRDASMLSSTRGAPARPAARGARVAWTTASGAARPASTAGIDDEGALLVLVGDRIERIVAGEVTWL